MQSFFATLSNRFVLYTTHEAQIILTQVRYLPKN